MEIKDQGSDDLIADLKGNQWFKGFDRHDGTLDLKVFNADKHVPEIFLAAEKRGLSIDSVNLRKPSLEDVFLGFTGKTLREREATQADRRRERSIQRARQ